MGEIGHNKPPDMCVTAGEVTNDLSRWMAENPAIETPEQAKEAKVFIDRANLCIKDLEDERKAQVGPLNEAVKKVNDTFRGPRELLGRVHEELKSRVDRFLVRVEGERIAAANVARLAAAESERLAREAEERERGAISGARSGECGIDVAGVSAAADAAFADYKAAEREAQLLERATKVKVTGGFTRAISLRDVKVVWVDEPVKAVADMEATDHTLSETIMDAILTAAKRFERKHGRYPEGIKVDTERRS